MAEDQNLEQTDPVEETGTGAIAPARKKRKAPVSRKASGDGNASAEPAARPRRYSDGEKVEKLGRIEAQVADGSTLKAAVKDAGISEQTFYQWKRTAAVQKAPRAKAAAEIDTLADLVALEAENKRLRGLLAEKLRAENAELRKRLKMD